MFSDRNEANCSADRITAIVISYNEERYLELCLSRLAFCDQLIVADLGSVDRSKYIARKFTTEIVNLDRVQYAGIAQINLLLRAENDWVLFVDPDEILPIGIGKKINKIIRKNSTLGMISMPWSFYFKGKQLKGTVWGGKNRKRNLFHRNRIIFSKEVHSSPKLKANYNTYDLPWISENVVKHYWVDDLSKMVEKHWRYIKFEGPTRFKRGQKFSILRCGWDTLRSFHHCYLKCSGYKDGLLGLFLSFFYATYIFMSHISLLK